MTEPKDTTEPSAREAYSPLKFEPSLYREHLQGMDLSPSQEDALLEAVWLVVVGVIDRGAAHTCRGSDSNPLAVDSSSVLGLVSTSKRSNSEVAQAEDGPRARRMDS
ncbi:hypothetical protein HMPREF9696_02657 [Afipia clevelandensis ATCC 49720]|uniref:Uncharacterized protein n=1 Tax=Afipia clevelandensis ATCC 49720 TaxID=883079 RepID=K8P6X0_9BRAD|nr:hypothetical protein HMPREF9696_02657 [Afipia clevelandensis ATCC 49720]